MITTDTAFENEETMSLQKAIMLYTDGHGGSFATVHEVSPDTNGVPSLQEGHPLTMEALNNLQTSVAKSAGGKRSFSGFLPENVLAVGSSSIVWWIPAAVRPLAFNCSDNLIGQATGQAPTPPLVFSVASDGAWSVFALKENTRPTLDTKLWQAPYFNVWQSGKICQGTTRIPHGATTQQIEDWNKAFFGSNFSHPNVHAPAKLVKYKGGAYQFWKDMLEGSFKKFPLRVLVETEYTLDDLIKASLNGGKL